MKRFLLFTIFWVPLFCISCNDENKVHTDDEAANRIPQALQNIQLAVQQNPDSAGLRLKLVYALDSNNLHKEALQQLDSLIQKDSLNYGLWYTKGQVAENAEDTLLALQCYGRAANIYESPEALRALANLYAETRNNRALLICSRIMALGLGRDYDADCNFISGVYYARTGDQKMALRFFDAAIANQYTYMEAYIEKGLIFFDRKDFTEALKVFQFAATVDNLYADAYYYQARCYEQMRIKDSAVLRFKQSLQLDANLTAAAEGLKRINDLK